MAILLLVIVAVGLNVLLLFVVLESGKRAAEHEAELNQRLRILAGIDELRQQEEAALTAVAAANARASDAEEISADRNRAYKELQQATKSLLEAERESGVALGRKKTIQGEINQLEKNKSTLSAEEDRLKSKISELEKKQNLSANQFRETSENLKEELRELDRRKKELETIKNTIAERSIKVDTKITELANLEAELKTKRAEKREFNALTFVRDDLSKEVGDLKSQLQDLELRANNARVLATQLPGLKADVKRFNRERDTLDSQIKSHEKAVEMAREIRAKEETAASEVRTLAGQLPSLSANVEALQQKQLELETRARIDQAAANKARSERNREEAALGDVRALRERLPTLRADTSRLEQNVLDLEREIEGKGRAARKARKELAAIRIRLQNAQAESTRAATLHLEIANLAAQKHRLEGEREQAKRLIADLQRRIGELQAQEQAARSATASEREALANIQVDLNEARQLTTQLPVLRDAVEQLEQRREGFREQHEKATQPADSITAPPAKE